MIDRNIVNEIKRLLAEGSLSQRAIGRLTGVSRGPVGAIASGRRPDYESLWASRNEPGIDPSAPKVRCTGCGGMVIMPCLACRDRTAIAKQRSKVKGSRFENESAELAFELHPDHQTRLDEVQQLQNSDPQSHISKSSSNVPADRAA